MALRTTSESSNDTLHLSSSTSWSAALDTPRGCASNRNPSLRWTANPVLSRGRPKVIVHDSGIPCVMLVAAVQTTATSDRQQNLEAAADLVEEAADDGAELVVLPELFSVAGSPDHLRNHAEDLDGPTLHWAAELAARRHVHLLAGSFPERAAGGQVFNTSCLLDPNGSIQASYRKIHLFDVQLPEAELRESAT